MAECTKCGEYTKFDGGLCLDCYKDKNGTVKNVNNNTRWVENVIKGRIAETLIEELFQNLGFQVFKYGMENTIPGIKELLRGIKGEVANDIKRMPDLVVFKDGRAHFIEVKFRANESFKLDDLEKKGVYPYTNALIVVVSKKHIKCISYEELKNGKEITPATQNYLGKRKEFETDNAQIIKFCEYAVKFFEYV